ncbi:PREDICTED: protein SET DOMAIN GROUP 41 [Prunus mume]|uniref:Protein SET DOMAIN GROUP 41 n=1 Tax=Prunus mume TaxID=102107 RepID=A0ABM0PD08_PRUMU|nr:PREDICTED: protein SET DOMAIN GROUP 41 [Prunus mume]
MEMEMEMRAEEDIEIGEDITPPLTPLAFALHDSLLSSHCSSCFSLLPPHPFPPLHFNPTFPHNPHHVLSSSSSFYCSPLCSTSDSPLHVSSAEPHLLHLLQSHPSTYPHGDSSDLRAALRLLHSLPATRPSARIAGLLTNHHKLLHHHDHHRIRDGARAMFLASKMRDEAPNVCSDNSSSVSPDDAVLEEAALCLVLTNAVEVQDKTGRTLGISVYGPSFCWINHSCSPNACYRFLVSPPPPTCSAEKTPLRIAPFGQGTQIESGVCSNNVFIKECGSYGPRVIVRSIKRIKKGEEVTVTYADLLQPKAMRQSELWSRYRFICSCTRCSASPLTYVDQVLEEISAANFNSSSLSSDINFDRDKATQRLTDYIDDAIDDYLSIGDPESSSVRLEHVLTQGLSDKQSECKEETSQLTYWLHPLHHLSLNAYTTLASAYKIRATDLSALYSKMDDHLLNALDLSRTSTAYSLLLAGATHHLFRSESSLIVSVANFWSSAGESLLTLARNSVWSQFVQRDLPVSNPSSTGKYRCPNCSLADKFETDSFHGQVRYADFDYVSNEFVDCVTNFTQNVWNFLGLGCQYLRVVKNPIDFSWLGTIRYSSVGEDIVRSSGTEVASKCGAGRRISGSEAEGYNNQVRMCLFKLGVHCLLYGGYLASICYGNSHLTRNVDKILDLEESIESLS